MKKKKKQIKQLDLPTEYFINEECSELFDYRLIMKGDHGIKSPVEELIEQKYYHLGINNPDYMKEEKIIALNNVLTNILLAASKGKVVVLSRRNVDYCMPRMYGFRHFTYRFIIGAVDVLANDKNGYAYQCKGFFSIKNKRGKRSRIWATEKLIKELKLIARNQSSSLRSGENKSELKLRSPEIFIKRIKYCEPIILKKGGKEKKIIEFEHTAETKRMKKLLLSYNEFISQYSITIPVNNYLKHDHFTRTLPEFKAQEGKSSLPLLEHSSVDSAKNILLNCQLHRVFNNSSFDQGGRFYGAAYQKYNEQTRLSILINGNPVTEIDYCALHPRMLYHSENIDYRDDPYLLVFGTKETREAVKLMMQIDLNARSRISANIAFNEEAQAEPDKIIQPMAKYGLCINKIRNKITSMHKTLRKFFFSGKGIFYQYTDSTIAEGILKYFTNKGIVCLCVHDSFIVERKYQDLLWEVMTDEYKKVMKFKPVLKINLRKEK